jgi:hypothetical protein
MRSYTFPPTTTAGTSDVCILPEGGQNLTRDAENAESVRPAGSQSPRMEFSAGESRGQSSKRNSDVP